MKVRPWHGFVLAATLIFIGNDFRINGAVDFLSFLGGTAIAGAVIAAIIFALTRKKVSADSPAAPTKSSAKDAIVGVLFFIGVIVLAAFGRGAGHQIYNAMFRAPAQARAPAPPDFSAYGTLVPDAPEAAPSPQRVLELQRQLTARVPDWLTIRETPVFKEWLARQSGDVRRKADSWDVNDAAGVFETFLNRRPAAKAQYGKK